MKCPCCGTNKDLSVKSVYPYKDDSVTTEIPIEPFLLIECQATTALPDGDWGFRMAILCHECWHRLEISRGIDIWISQECWESLGPVTPFNELPLPKHFLPPDSKEVDVEKWNAANYATT